MAIVDATNNFLWDILTKESGTRISKAHYEAV